ncbi:hypothetical protein GW17_00002920 [Ensete ventricosum]|nr:hypothetical protein GW17_00002920 [Ensete ventricosum]
MSQEHLSTNPNLEHLGGQAHILLPTLQTGGPNPLLPTNQTSTPVPTPNGYWRLLNDPGFSPLTANLEPLPISAKAFFDLTRQAQMALYDTSDSLMCHAFPTTLRGPAGMWYSRLRPSSIAFFDSLAKKFKLNFMASSHPRLTATSLLGLRQGSDNPLVQFIGRFTAEV